MGMKISMLASATVLAFAPVLGAQQKQAPKKEPPQVRSGAPERDGCVTTDGRTECVFRRGAMDSVMKKRPVLGIELRPTGTMRDTLGVFVASVTPDGPAEKAGIYEGDRIVSINGIDLRQNASDAKDRFAEDLHP